MTGKHMYRIDKFVVPAQAREEFIGKARESIELLRTMPGYVRGALLERSSGPDELNIVTIAEWESAEVVERVKAAMAELYRQRGFNPQEMYDRLGIKLDRGDYLSAEL